MLARVSIIEMMFGKYNSKRAFTLIEVLVVVSIIVVLTTIILSVIFNARSESRDIARSTIAQQLSLGIRLYKEAGGTYPDFPAGVELGVGNPIDALLQPFLNQIHADPLGDSKGGGVYGFWYYSNFNCNGEVHDVVVVRKMENDKNGNYSTKCNVGGFLIPEHKFNIIPTAYAGAGPPYTQSAYVIPCVVNTFTATPVTLPFGGGIAQFGWTTTGVAPAGVSITPAVGSGLANSGAITSRVTKSTSFTLTGAPDKSHNTACTQQVSVSVSGAPVYTQSGYTSYVQSAYYAQTSYPWSSSNAGAYIIFVD